MRDFEKHEEMMSGIYLDETLQHQLVDESTKLILTFFFDDGLFNDEFTNYSSIAGNIVGLTLSKDIRPLGSFW